MHSATIIFHVFASLVLHAHGDLMMQSRTYDLNATATDAKGKTLPVIGKLLSIRVVYLSTKGQQQGDDVKFSISANSPDTKSANILSKDFSEDVPTALFDSLVPLQLGPEMVDDEPVIGVPSQTFQISPRFGTADSKPPQPFHAVPRPAHPNSAESQSSSSSSQSGSGAKSNVHLANSNSGPLPGPLNRNPGPPSSFNGANASAKSASTTQSNLHNRANNTNRNNEVAHGAAGNEHLIMKRSVGYVDNSTQAKRKNEVPKTYKIQNVTILPNNRSTSINLSPVGGYPWIKNGTGNDINTQTYEIIHYLNLTAPIKNVSVSSSPSSVLDDGDDAWQADNLLGGGLNHYDTLDDLLNAANKNATSDLGPIIEGFFNNSGHQSSSTPSIDDFMNVMEEELNNMMSDEKPDKTDRYSFAGTGIPVNTHNTTSRYDGTVTDHESSPLISGTGSNTTANNSTAVGSGNVMMSSWLMIFVSLIAIFSSVAA